MSLASKLPSFFSVTSIATCCPCVEMEVARIHLSPQRRSGSGGLEVRIGEPVQAGIATSTWYTGLPASIACTTN